jgi:hypothetical protein
VAYTPKAWANFATKTTPINATALRALEQRVSSFATAEAVTPGGYDWNAFRVVQNPAGANMQVGVGIAASEMLGWVRDASLGMYRYTYNGAQLLVTIAAADATNPRIDRIVMTAPTSTDSITPQVVVLTGTATAGATLDNLTGVQAVPTGYELLADVLVAAGAATIVTASIRDRRRVGGGFGNPGVLPYGSTQMGTVVQRDEVFLVPHQSFSITANTLTPTTHDNMQGAYLAFLPRRIVAATRLRWQYAQGATPAVTNYNLALTDASGRLVVAGGATAFAGAANSFNEIALTITATTFEPGYYYVWLGVAALTAASAVSFVGPTGNRTVTNPVSSFRNLRGNAAAGGTTFNANNTLATLADVAAMASVTNVIGVPVVALSVG